MMLVCGQSSNLYGPQVSSILLMLFHRETIFKMLALKQLAQKWSFDRSNPHPHPPGYGPAQLPSPLQPPTGPPGYGPAQLPSPTNQTKLVKSCQIMNLLSADNIMLVKAPT